MNSSFSCFFGGRGDANRLDTVLETMGNILSFTWMGLVTAWTYDGIFEVTRGVIFHELLSYFQEWKRKSRLHIHC